jgi:hypothetical protein
MVWTRTGGGAQVSHVYRNVLFGVLRISHWLDTMRHPLGYSGPISHWWESQFLYTGPQVDWRYEGIIDGYCELFLRTNQQIFLDKAIQAANDVLYQVMPDGRFQRSSFQFGPMPGGTPHEAAVDIGLLGLAKLLKIRGDERFGLYLDVARLNLQAYWMGALWNGQGFQDQPYHNVLVANKHGTLLEALVRLQALGVEVSRDYMEACVRVIKACQVRRGPQAGGTVHAGIGPSRLAIPLYTARAMNGLALYYQFTEDRMIKDMLMAATDFIVTHLTPNGIAWGTYGNGRKAQYPELIAGSGDVLRYFVLLQDLGLNSLGNEIDSLVNRLLANQLPSGAIPTARGFAAKGLGPRPVTEEWRDVLPVVGWNDKAFRALIALLPDQMKTTDAQLKAIPAKIYQREVLWHGKAHLFEESPRSFELRDEQGRVRYRWIKGSFSPSIYNL